MGDDRDLLNAASRLQAERERIAEVAVSEAIQETKAGDAVEALGRFRDAHRGEIAGYSEKRNLYLNEIDGIGAGVCTPE